MSKNKSKIENKRRRPAWVDMFAKTQKVDDRTGHSQDWHTDVPNIKLSRAFVVVLILHVVAVGGILAFEMFKPESSRAATAESGSVAKLDVDQPAGSVNQGVQGSADPEFPTVIGDQSDDGYVRYIVQRGDTIRAIANSYSISRTELLAANSIDERHPLVQGRIFRIPKALLTVRSADVATTPGPGGIADEFSENNGGDGFVLLNSAGVVADQPVSSGENPEISVPVSAGSSHEDGFLPLGRSVIPTNPGAIASKAVGTPDRPRVVRERPAVAAKALVVSLSSRHTVAQGDTLYGISRKYGVSVGDLLGANPGVDPRTLGIGKTLRIP
jgi:LysM repeat protein